MVAWKETYRQARLEKRLDDGKVRCLLSPRNCTMEEGSTGFCKMRGNKDGRLVTYNYGKGVHHTEEAIETEAVFHYTPGDRTLSLGNIGCMLSCSYCQNWKTSQAKHLDENDVFEYTPEGIVEMALRHDIRTLSWTYNDPVVWHEFVRDTAKLAKEAGLTNLYKSAFFITEEAIEELLPYIDIFSISVKTVDDKYYRKVTAGWLQPVLDATKQVFKAGKHVEVSTLMITDLSDDEVTAREVSEWVLTELGPHVPVHFVRFHPDYRLRDTVRTPVDRLMRAQAIGREMGIEHVYVGNVRDPDAATTFCAGCGERLVTRYGLNARVKALDEKGCCTKCGRDAHFNLNYGKRPAPQLVSDLPAQDVDIHTFDWHGDISSLHVQARNPGSQPVKIHHRRRHARNGSEGWQYISLNPGESYRFMLSQGEDGEVGPEIAVPKGLQTNLHEVFDRAHFPTVSVKEGVAESDTTPLPVFEGKLQPLERIKDLLERG